MAQLRRYCFPSRPDWNGLGPRIPAWFRMRLQRVDPRLVLQFIPPKSEMHPDGCDPVANPHGVWAICRRLKHTRWLFKRWTWSLADAWGRYQPPGPDTINLIRMARDLFRRGDVTRLEDEFDATMARALADKQEKSRARLRQKVAQRCREYDMRVGHHVFIRDTRKEHAA